MSNKTEEQAKDDLLQKYCIGHMTNEEFITKYDDINSQHEQLTTERDELKEDNNKRLDNNLSIRKENEILKQRVEELREVSNNHGLNTHQRCLEMSKLLNNE